MIGFEPILKEVVENVPGAIGAAFVAWDGEPVGTFAPDMPTLDLAIIGAQWALVWRELVDSLGRARLGAPLELLVEGEQTSVLVGRVTDHYHLVLAVGREAHLAIARRELERGVASLQKEM